MGHELRRFWTRPSDRTVSERGRDGLVSRRRRRRRSVDVRYMYDSYCTALRAFVFVLFVLCQDVVMTDGARRGDVYLYSIAEASILEHIVFVLHFSSWKNKINHDCLKRRTVSPVRVLLGLLYNFYRYLQNKWKN